MISNFIRETPTMQIDLSNKALGRLVKKSGNFCQSLQMYLGRRIVLYPERFGKKEATALRASREWVEDCLDRGTRNMQVLDIPGVSDCRVLMSGETGSRMILLSDEGEIVGGKFCFVPYVLPRFRGKGYGKLMAFMVDIYHHNAVVSHYSEEGFHARLGAHSLHVSIAMHFAPKKLQNLMLSKYRIQDRKACLLEPWTVEDQNQYAGILKSPFGEAVHSMSSDLGSYVFPVASS